MIEPDLPVDGDVVDADVVDENVEDEEDEEEQEDAELIAAINVFATLENEYKDILSKIQENSDFFEYGEVYTKLFEAYFKSYAHECELKEKSVTDEKLISTQCHQLNSNKRRVDANCETISSLKDELQQSCQLADKAHTREQLCQEIIESMRGQILKLNTELEMKLKMGDEDDMGAFNKTKEGFEREKQKMIDEIQSLKIKLVAALSYSEELERTQSLADLRTIELNTLVEQQVSEAAKKQKIIEKLEENIEVIKTVIESINVEITVADDNIYSSQKYIKSLEIQLKDTRLVHDKMKRLSEANLAKYEKCNADLNTLNKQVHAVKEKYVNLHKIYKTKLEEVRLLRADLADVKRQRDTYQRKATGLENIKNDVEQQRDKLRLSLEHLNKELTKTKKIADSDRREYDNLVKEKEIMHKNNQKIQSTVDGHRQLIKVQEQTRHKLESTINNYLTELSEQKKVNKKLEADRDKTQDDNLELARKVEDSIIELRMKDIEVHGVKKSLTELETKLRQQQNLYEAVRADRNAIQKSLQSATNQVADFKIKYKISVHQNGQLKEDIVAKEALLTKEENIQRKLSKERENLKAEVQANLLNIKELKHQIEMAKQHEKDLLKHIQDLETTIRKQSKNLEQLMNDRDVIGAQLVRRNDEIGLLYEKIKILEITLNTGESQYDQRIEDITILKLEINRLRQEKNFLSRSISNMIDLKHEVSSLEKELALEKLKCRALEDELQHPMNVHRWRQLEGSDPAVLDLLQKIQILQKRIITDANISANRSTQTKETEKLYFDLRQVLVRQPSPQITEQLVKTQQAFMVRGKKIKCLIMELHISESQIQEYKTDMDKLTETLKQIKFKYFKQKKQNEKYATRFSTKKPAIQIQELEELQPKYTGGGYKMSV